jgi:DNA-binding LytR/AlgR family response regulator
MRQFCQNKQLTKTIIAMENTVHIGSYKHVPVTELMLLKADINYTDISFNNGRKNEYVATTLKILEERLQDYSYFFRINNSIIVNLNYVAALGKQRIYLHDGSEIIASRRRWKVFLEKWNSFSMRLEKSELSYFKIAN